MNVIGQFYTKMNVVDEKYNVGILMHNWRKLN